MSAPSSSALARSSTLTSQPFSLKDFLGSFMLFELFKGLALTGKHADVLCRACHRGKGAADFETLTPLVDVKVGTTIAGHKIDFTAVQSPAAPRLLIAATRV